MLDMRGSEDRGTYPMILENTFTTRQPLNINDEDIDPTTEYEPKERVGVTDMTFCLITCEGANIVRRLNYVPPTASDEELEAYGRETERIVQERADYVDSKLLSMPSDPRRMGLYKLSSMVAKLHRKKTWLCCQYPLQMSRKAPRSDANREEILSTAISIIENDLKVQSNPRFPNQWDWYARAFVQWHPLSVALVQLCLQTTGPVVDYAWSVVDRFFDDIGNSVADNRKGTLWKPIKRLHLKAQIARAQALRNQMNVMPEMDSGPDPYQKTHSIRAAEQTPETFLSSTPFGSPVPPRDGNQMMMQPEVTNMLSESFIPAIGDMYIDQRNGNSVDWTEWCEFVNSTWDGNQLPLNGGGNTNFGFWTV